MATIQLDAVLREKLNGLNQPLQLRDETGVVVGQFLPQAQFERLMYLAAEAQCPYTREELESMRQEQGGQSLRGFLSGLSS